MLPILRTIIMILIRIIWLPLLGMKNRCIIVKNRCFFVRRIITLLAVGVFVGELGCVSCDSRPSYDDNALIVSIEPLRFLVEQIVGNDFDITVLVPPGTSPETYEPTPRQIRAAEDARLVFSTGLIGFETVMLQKFSEPDRFVDLSAGMNLVTTLPSEPHAPHHDHSGADPHIWMAPKELSTMARTAYERIHEIWPDSTSYTVNYECFAERLEALDREVSDKIAASEVQSFMIFHPGLTYYARDYGLHQIALENDGKEPSAKQLAGIIATARAEGITKILYQNEFPLRTVAAAAVEIGAEPVEIGILDYDVIGNILMITDLIAGNDNANSSELHKRHAE